MKIRRTDRIQLCAAGLAGPADFAPAGVYADAGAVQGCRYFTADGLWAGPGQANNIGTVYESLGFAGGRSFALSLAAAGFLTACIIGVIYLNFLQRKGVIKRSKQTEDEEILRAGGVGVFQDANEIRFHRLLIS